MHLLMCVCFTDSGESRTAWEYSASLPMNIIFCSNLQNSTINIGFYGNFWHPYLFNVYFQIRCLTRYVYPLYILNLIKTLNLMKNNIIIHSHYSYGQSLVTTVLRLYRFNVLRCTSWRLRPQIISHDFKNNCLTEFQYYSRNMLLCHAYLPHWHWKKKSLMQKVMKNIL